MCVKLRNMKNSIALRMGGGGGKLTSHTQFHFQILPIYYVIIFKNIFHTISI